MLPSKLLEVIADVIARLESLLPDQALTTAIEAVSRVLGVGS
jgi:hypothetical protein